MKKSKIIFLFLFLSCTRTYYLGLPSNEKKDVSWALEKKFLIIGKNNQFITLNKLLSKSGLIMHFWATWCKPCIEELPLLDQLNDQINPNSNFPQIITFAVDDNIENITSFNKILDTPLSLLILHDKGGVFAKELGTIKFPETYLVNEKGQIIHKWIGHKNWFLFDTLKVINY